MPTWLGIILLLAALGLVIALAFAAWRLVAHLKAVLVSVNRLNNELAPVLEELTRHTDEIARKAARLSERQLGQRDPSGT